MRQINRIFVYGSLQPGMQNESILKNLNGNWKKGFVLGELLNINSGENYGYPVLKINKIGSKIYGMVFESYEIKKKIEEIDKFEGENYKRIIGEVYLESGLKKEAYIYGNINFNMVDNFLKNLLSIF